MKFVYYNVLTLLLAIQFFFFLHDFHILKMKYRSFNIATNYLVVVQPSPKFWT